jgi:hypothetical protein
MLDRALLLLAQLQALQVRFAGHDPRLVNEPGVSPRLWPGTRG